MSIFDQQLEKIRTAPGFIAALDQSGGSTPTALGLYGVEASEYQGDAEMFSKVHEMRTRIMTDKTFTGKHILGAILFENTMDRTVENLSTAQYLWEQKKIIPFLKVDKGLDEEKDGTQTMKPMPGLDDLLEKAKASGIFGTKMRSVIKQVNEKGINDVVKQQFEIGKQIIKKGLIPIIEPEVDIHTPNKADAEDLLLSALLTQLDQLETDQLVMLKLTLPEKPNLYTPCINHPNVIRVVALSGGYPREEANQQLSQNIGMIASFSRALSEGLSSKQNDESFSQTLNNSIKDIYQASIT